jgi:hypothetical protein
MVLGLGALDVFARGFFLSAERGSFAVFWDLGKSGVAYSRGLWVFLRWIIAAMLF